MEKPNTRPRVSLVTFGCRVNQYETQMMRERLAESFEVVSNKADLYLVNACTVTSLAERKARQAMRRLRREHPYAKIVLIGCLADAVVQGQAQIDEADLLAGNAWKVKICEVVSLAFAGKRGVLPNIASTPLAQEQVKQHLARVRAFLKVQDGCDLACTFCRTTQVRGRSRSKPVAAALSEAQQLVKNGYPEIVLTGINLAQYNPCDGNLADLMQEILSIDGLKRLRLGSINPVGITENLLEVFAADQRACAHFHIPLQSGDETILLHMRRGYTPASFCSQVELVRQFIPEATFGADVIVGFPGEDKAAFAKTCAMIEKVGFANLHIFRYSPRKGTSAVGFSDIVPEREKKERAERLEELRQRVQRNLFADLLGSKQDVLVEERRNGYWRGYTRGYIDTHILAGENMTLGDEVRVRIMQTSDTYIEGVKQDRTDEH